MSIREYNVHVATDFVGPQLRRDDSDLPSEAAKLAVNVEYTDGSVSTRTGFGAVWTPNEVINSLYNWIKGADAVSTSGNLLLYYTPTSSKVRYVPNLASPSPVDLFTLASGYGANHAPAGTRIYSAVFNTAGEGQGQCRVSSGFDSVGTVSTDKCFPAPMSTVPTISEPGASGFCTAGVHRFAYYILTRSGHRGKLGPYSGTTFSPVSFTANENKTIRFSLNATWPADALGVYVAMTTASNLSRYLLVPGGNTTVTGGATSTVNIDISISDDDLLATATDITDYTLWMTQDGSGNGPFHPSHVLPIGTRMGYLTRLNGVSQLYASEPAQFQQITPDQHVVELPGQREIKTAFTIGRTVYLVGPNWTYATMDTGEKPVLWPAPDLVDGMIGTPSPTGVDTNASRGIAFVADQGGLYVFAEGAYSSKPISFGVESDWQRINWTYAKYQLKVVDNKEQNCVYVFAPIDGATSPNAQFVFDYSDGLTWDRIRYSFNTVANYFPGGACMVQHPTSGRRELWIGSHLISGAAISQKVLRQKNSVDDAQPFNDDGLAISYTYKTAPFPSPALGINAHHMVRMRIVGSGNTTLTVYRMDDASSKGPFTLTLSTAPNNDVKKQFYLSNTPAVSYEFTGSTADSHFRLSRLESYYNPFAGL